MENSSLKSEMVIDYNFKFEKNGVDLNFSIKLDPITLSLIPKTPLGYPEWIVLNHRKCPLCTLDASKNKYCPVARNLIDLVDSFKGYKGEDVIDITINTESRGYIKKTTLEEGIRSIMGIYMVTSGCPVLDKLRPMVKFHLPFANQEETKYRAITMYLMAQYLLRKRGAVPDWDLNSLQKIYNDIKVVDEAFCKRLQDSALKDASVSAIVKLNFFAGYISSWLVDKHTIDQMEQLFSAYL